MIFPPHIAPPCNFPCCRPTSSSVPRYFIGRRNSFSLLTNQRSLTPPRPPPLRNEINYSSIPNTPAGKLKQQYCFYKVVPIMKPSSSMPGGLATKYSGMHLSNDANNVSLDKVTSQYHCSQPNLLSPSGELNQESTRSHDSKSIENITSAINGLSMINSCDDNVNNARSSGSIHIASSRNIRRMPHTVEPRTTAYYYNELIHKPAIFNSKLNLLNDAMKEGNHTLEYFNSKSSDQSNTIPKSAEAVPLTAVDTSVRNNIDPLATQTGIYNSHLSANSKQNNKQIDMLTSTTIINSNSGMAKDDCNGNFEASMPLTTHPSSNSSKNVLNNINKAVVQVEGGNVVPTPTARNFSTLNPPSASSIKNSSPPSMHYHNFNKNSCHTNNKLCSISAESNNNFGGSNERIA